MYMYRAGHLSPGLCLKTTGNMFFNLNSHTFHQVRKLERKCDIMPEVLGVRWIHHPHDSFNT